MNRIHIIFGGVLLLLFAAIAGHRLLTDGDAHDAAVSPHSSGQNYGHNSGYSSAPRTQDDERSVRFWQLHRQAGAERIAGNYELAIRLYEGALELDPRHEDALYYLSNVYLEVGRLDAAERTLERLTDAYPANARGRLRRGELYLCYADQSVYDPEQAAAEFARAIRLNQEETGPMLRRAQAALVLNNLHDAHRWFTAIVATNESSIEAHFLLGYVSWKASNHDAAEAHFREAYRLLHDRDGIDDPVVGEGDRKEGTNIRPDEQQTCPAMETLLAPLLARTVDANGQDIAEAHYAIVERQLERLGRRMTASSVTSSDGASDG